MTRFKYNKTVYRITGQYIRITRLFLTEEQAEHYASYKLCLKSGTYNIVSEVIVCR